MIALAAGLAALTLLSSFTSGLLGAGGAILLIPLALYVLPLVAGSQLDPHQVSGLVLVQSVGSAVGGATGFHRRGHLDARLLLLYGPLLGAGGLAGALASALLPGRGLLLAFALVTTGAAALMVFQPRIVAEPPSGRHRVAAGVLLVVIGLLGGAIGVGAGFLTIPVMLYLLATPHRVASGTGLAMTFCLAAPALVGKAVTGQVIWLPAAGIAAAALAGSWLGAHLSARVPVRPLRLALAALVALLALRVWADLL